MKNKPNINYSQIYSALNCLKERQVITNFDIIKERIQSLICNSFIKKSIIKEELILNILGCTYEEFKIHIENQFQPWMSWDNYGKYNGELNFGWDFDHIIPISSALTYEEIIKLNHYTNFQPLCSKTNRYIKKNKLNY